MFDKKSSNAPVASPKEPCPAQTPTTANGGTKEMAIATPGKDRGHVPAGEGDGARETGGHRGDEVE